MALPFEDLGSFKTALKQIFSEADWTADDAAALSDLVAPHLDEGWWEHDLGDGLVLTHGIDDGRYLLFVTGAATDADPGLFDRVFEGPVKPEPTPHPRKVKFAIGGTPAPGVWYQRHDPEAPTDQRVATLFREPDVSDVMVAGDFVTIGLDRGSSWEDRLDDLLAVVAELFATEATAQAPARTRDELLAEGRSTGPGGTDDVAPVDVTDLHLLDPSLPHARQRLTTALDDPDARIRRIAVAVLAESESADERHGAITRGYADPSRIVRRTAIDTAADLEDPAFRPILETALEDNDAWIRWKAVRTLGEIDPEPSRDHITKLADDPDFQVRFEVAKVLRSEEA